MAKFLVKASYTPEGVKGVQSAGGASRREAVAKMAEGLGGSLESFYFAFGDTDAYVVLDLPLITDRGGGIDRRQRNRSSGVRSDRAPDAGRHRRRGSPDVGRLSTARS